MIEFETKREDDELVVKIKGAFTIPYEGSSEWLADLWDFIDQKSI